MSITKDISGSVTRGLTGYFDFNGRASRRDFWIWFGFLIIVNNIFEALYWLLVVPTIAYGARRMHDVGKSAWWLLVSPIALFFALRPSVSGYIGATAATPGGDWISARKSDAQSLAKAIRYKFDAVRNVITDPSSSSATARPGTVPTPPAPSGTAARTVAAESSEPAKSAKLPRTAKKPRPTDTEMFLKMASSLGIDETSDESIVAVVQSLIRRVWMQVRAQQESDPIHTDHLRLALRALADFDDGRFSPATKESTEKAKARMWYGILLALVTTDDFSPTTIGTHSKMSSSAALREACRIFESNGDKKMAGRCMEELGQYGRLLNREDLCSEGFNSAVELFRSAGAADRANQAVTNAGSNFQRHSSAFFDGGQHSLKATTILGSVQGERLRAVLHHLD